MSFKENFKVL